MFSVTSRGRPVVCRGPSIVPHSRIIRRAWRIVRVEQETIVDAISSSVILSSPCSLLIMIFWSSDRWTLDKLGAIVEDAESTLAKEFHSRRPYYLDDGYGETSEVSPHMVEHADFGSHLHNQAANLPRCTPDGSSATCRREEPVHYVLSNHGREGEIFDVAGLAASPRPE